MGRGKRGNFTSDVDIQCETVLKQFAVIPVIPFAQIHLFTNVLQQPIFSNRSVQDSDSGCNKQIDSVDEKVNNNIFKTVRRKKCQDNFTVQNHDNMNFLEYTGQHFPPTMTVNFTDLVWELPNSLPPIKSKNCNQEHWNKRIESKTESLEGFSWHKCSHNDSVIHICKKSKIQLSHNSLHEISNHKITMSTLQNNLYDIKLDSPIQRSVIVNNMIHQNKNKTKKLDEPKILKNKQKKCSSNNGCEKTPDKERIKQQNMSSVNKLINYNEKSNNTLYKSDHLKNELFQAVSKEFNNLILPEQDVYETSNKHLSDIREDAPDGMKIPCPTDIMISHSSLDSIFDQENLKYEYNSLIRPESQESVSSNKIQRVLLKINETYKTSSYMTKDSGPIALIALIAHGALQEYIYQEYEKYSETLEHVNIPEDKLGIDKETSILFILKMMEANTNQISSLLFSPRQKIKFSMAIYSSMNNLKIGGSVWRTICLDVIKNVLGEMKNNFID